MTLEEECTLSYYRTVDTLDSDRGVYLVKHTESGKLFVKKELTVYDAAVYRYLKERHVSRTPYIYEVIEDNDRLIVIEEYISGSSLEDILKEKGVLSEEQAVKTGLQLCVILAQLHNGSPAIVHRDIKPSNIIISPEGTVTLLDMNAAKQYQDHAGRDTRLMGTAGYAAPEQYGFGASSPRTDIYAMGVLLNVMVTGKFPSEKPAEGKLGRIVAKCTQLRQEERYDSVYELRSQLADVMKKTETEPKKTADIYDSPHLPGFRGGKTWKKVLAALGYLLLILTGLSIRVEGGGPAALWANRLVFWGIELGIILFSANYLNIWKKLGITRVKSPALRIILIVAADMAIFSTLLMILVIFEQTIQN